jgi:hypothetical protein
MSEEEKINGDLDFAQRLTDSVEAFATLDGACDKVKEKKICDAVGVKCDSSCKIYVKKDRLLKFLEECLKATPATVIPLESSMIHVEPEKPKEKRCPSCGIKAARPDSKYCDYCGEEF